MDAKIGKALKKVVAAEDLNDAYDAVKVLITRVGDAVRHNLADGEHTAVGLVGSFIAGAATGAAITSILTPVSGPELREVLRQKVSGLSGMFGEESGLGATLAGEEGVTPPRTRSTGSRSGSRKSVRPPSN